MSQSPTKVLFVCMGNICRSPAAEIIFDHIVREAGCEKNFLIDSAGTLGIHRGNPPDPRMVHTLKQRHYRIFGTSRKITAADLDNYDHILVMDADNEREVRALDSNKSNHAKISRLTSHCRSFRADHVPDPYYGGAKGFEDCADLIEDACRGLLEDLVKS